MGRAAGIEPARIEPVGGSALAALDAPVRRAPWLHRFPDALPPMPRVVPAEPESRPAPPSALPPPGSGPEATDRGRRGVAGPRVG